MLPLHTGIVLKCIKPGAVDPRNTSAAKFLTVASLYRSGDAPRGAIIVT